MGLNMHVSWVILGTSVTVESKAQFLNEILFFEGQLKNLAGLTLVLKTRVNVYTPIKSIHGHKSQGTFTQ